MDILQVNKFYHPIVGGIEQVVQDLVNGIHDQGHEATVLVSRERGLGTKDIVDRTEVVRTTSLGVILSTPLAPSFPARLRQFAASADIVHYHLPNPLAVTSHFIAGHNTPTVVTYHSDIVRQTQALKVYGPLLKHFLNDVDHIIATSPQLRYKSPFLRSHQEKCSVVPLWVDPSKYDPDAWSEPPVETDNPVVLFVGRLSYYKGVEYLIEAIGDVTATLVVVGDGERRDDLETLTASSSASDRIHFLGHVSESTLKQCYTSADLFVLPSVEPSEAFGKVQLEAMAHGLPVVNTALPTGVPWVSKDGETGITVPPRDATALASALRTLLENPDTRQRYGQNARRRVESKFSEEAMINRMFKIYRSII